MSHRINVTYIDKNKKIPISINFLNIRKIEDVFNNKHVKAIINIDGVYLKVFESREDIKRLIKEKI
jgi:hypothetical protein